MDVSAYAPRQVHQLADVLDGRLDHYVQVSSVSAYDPTIATVHRGLALVRRPGRGHRDDGLEVLRSAQGRVRAGCSDALRRVQNWPSCALHTCADRTTTRTASPIGLAAWPRAATWSCATPPHPCRSSTCVTSARFLVRCAVNEIAGAFDGVGPFAPTSELLEEITPQGVVGPAGRDRRGDPRRGRDHVADDDRRSGRRRHLQSPRNPSATCRADDTHCRRDRRRHAGLGRRSWTTTAARGPVPGAGSRCRCRASALSCGRPCLSARFVASPRAPLQPHLRRP